MRNKKGDTSPSNYPCCFLGFFRYAHPFLSRFSIPVAVHVHAVLIQGEGEINKWCETFHITVFLAVYHSSSVMLLSLCSRLLYVSVYGRSSLSS